MIRFVKGNLLESSAQALVNTVNTVGVMGKGIALQFKEAYPNNYILYRKACKDKLVRVGSMFITHEQNVYGINKIIVNFPTKTTWRKPSEYSYIEMGLKDLKDKILEYHIESIAIPPLGSHNGGLDWNVVKQMIINQLSELNCDIILYEPNEAIIELMKSERVKLTPARAMLLYMLCSLVSEGEFASEFAAEKLAYFLQKFGSKDSFKLQFRQYYYGPYSGKVRFVLHYLNGSYLKGVGQMEQKPFDPIWLSPDTFKDVQDFFAKEENRHYEDICKKTASFLSGFYSNYLLELLSTVDFILHNNADLKEWLIMKPQKVYELVILHINQWSERKKYLFNNEEYVRLVLNHLYQFEKQNTGLLYV